ncbi:MAG: OmpA family protein [Bryobacterales bacterium]|nr:OmpA family protein [Bryobacterales bacterium]
MFPAAAQETAEEMQAQLQVLYELRPSVAPVRVFSYTTAEGTFQLDMQGSDLARGASGELRIRSRVSYNEIDLRVKGLPAPQSIGPEFLTYVVWAISPAGLGTNLGELSLERGEGRLRTQTDLQSFGLIVTAEPFFATTTPGDTVVLENVASPGEKRSPTLASVDTRFMPRGQYKVGAELGEVKPFTFEAGVPLDVYQARNALLVGKRTSTDRFVPEGYKSGQSLLAKAEELHYGGDAKGATASAREAVQVMGDAIRMSLERQEKVRSELISRAADDRVRRATATAEDAERRMQQALSQQASAEKATREAEQKRLKAEDEMRIAVDERRRAQQEAIEARQVAQKLVQEQRQLRDLLVERLNQVLATEDTERGLVVKLSDILFDPGKFTLKTETKVLLARIAGILSWAPGIVVQVEGHTDNTGDAGKNQELSEKRAAAVGNFLVEQGMPASNITSVGYGETRPLAANNSRDGRELNRRVELVLSGEMIGARVGTPQGQ